MPLLHRKPFRRQPPPPGLRAEEEVFLCKITHEVFRTYDEFFERTILCNSLVWSCALTGKASLTYLEALESERRARQSLQSFSPALLLPLLHLVAASRRCRLAELCDDVYGFVKERFFPGEMVDVMERSGLRHVCEVLEVLPPHSNGKGSAALNGHSKPAGGDTIIISDNEDDPNDHSGPMSAPLGQSKTSPLPASMFCYSVRRVKADGQQSVVKSNQISRKKNTLSRERLKLLFKQHCEPQYGSITLKPSTVLKYTLADQTFSQFFPDEPNFPFSPPPKGRGSLHGIGSPGRMTEKRRLEQQKEEMMAAMQEQSRLKKDQELQEARRREREEMRERIEEEKQRRRDEKERMKVEKEREREKLKEERKRYAERQKLWNKPREDMELEDLKELPSPVPVQSRLPAVVFGEALMVVEFLRVFGDLFDLQDEFPDGVSLEVLEEALVGRDPEGPLCELLFFFLSAILQALSEEGEEAAKEQRADELSEVLDDDADHTHSAISAVALLAAAWPQLHQGCSLKQLDLDSCTLSEILRLHILASGADCNHGNAKFRYQKQGGFLSTDDPCVEFRLAHPALVKKLSSTAVYDLTPGEKLCVLQALCGKLLTLVSTRVLIEDSAEEQRAARQELREIRAEQHRREREEAAFRVRQRKEEKLREQEQRLKEKEERIREEERSGITVEDEEANSKKMKAQLNQKERLQQTELGAYVSPLSAEKLEEEQNMVRELQECIQKAAHRTSMVPLGRDRLYRRYWLLPSTPALFVEEDGFALTEDMLLPRPAAEEEEEEEEDEDEEDEEEEEGQGADGEEQAERPGPAHASGPPVTRPNQWAYYSSMEEVEVLLEALNPRGQREGGLRDALLQERDRLQVLLDGNAAAAVLARQGDGALLPPAESYLETRLRDLLLDIEDRIYQGTLGYLKVKERTAWRSVLEKGRYELLSSDGKEAGGAEPVEVQPTRARDRLQGLRAEGGGGSGSVTPQGVSPAVRSLALALVQVEQGIERKFLKAPLGEEEKKDLKLIKKSKKKDEEQASDDGSEGRLVKTVLERWRESLMACSSLSQVFVHLSTLERSVMWSRSLLNTRCKICRRKGDSDAMLLCDGCDRGHHMHCLRPRLKSVPSGDWFCPSCRPKQRSGLSSARQRASSQSEEEEEEEEEKELVVKSSKSSKVKISPRSKPATPSINQTTPKASSAPLGKGSSANRASGKKATPSSSRAGAGPSGRTPKLQNGVTPPPSNARKRPLAEKTPSPKAPLPILTVLPPSSSSSNRRSSGRNHGVHELSACERLTVELVRHEDSWPFIKLVSRTQLPDYYEIIQRPIALSIIREKVNNCDYKTSAQYMEDVDLMFSNCLQYNPRHTNEAKAGVRLQNFYHAELAKLGLPQPRDPAPKRPRM
ncbi:bromodomain adjacent to zinc finger domain protein 1A isoform X2 [Gadus macrocephalus]|uniref:bromodomain adjacent to zinc finger domain protein 1A isoform X2 n=1 Tax=Gadus macrocephalus TaxID=80720 RepID=UPI0028CB1906|nr:bromodomain adjacent to zinc finger domain protein 1A isoform X2 [Gadus macrocephalus]